MKALLALLTSTAFVTAALAQEPQSQSGQGSDIKAESAEAQHEQKVAEQIAAAWPSAPVEETESVTAHSMVAHGKTLKYHATAGTVTIQTDTAKPTASIF